MDDAERKAQIRHVFDTVADGYDNPALQLFPRSAEHLVRHLGLAGHEHVLDLACGTGTVSLRMAREVPRGRVTGIDLSDGMLAQAARKAAAQRIDNVDFRCMDMDALDFPDDHFDAAASGFGVFFLPDMAGGLRRVARCLKPGARVAVSSFADGAFAPLDTLFLERIRRYGVEPPPLSWKRLDQPEKIRALFADSGLETVAVRREQVGYYLNDAEAWWDLLWHSGYRGLLDRLSFNDLIAFKAEHLREIAALAGARGLWLDVAILIGLGRKAGRLPA